MLEFLNEVSESMRVRSPFCLGVDPSEQLLEAWGLPVSALGLGRMCGAICEASSGLAFVKPQSAYFERFGDKGAKILIDLIASFKQMGTFVILDVKRGDIGSTNDAYARAILGDDSAYKADFMTLSPYLGLGAFDSLIDHAASSNCGVLVVARSSNPEGDEIQLARVRDGRTVVQFLCDSITAINRRLGARTLGPVGAVVGATHDEVADILDRLPQSLILAPGVGHQGATYESLANSFGAAAGRVIPTAARSVLKAGPDVASLRNAIVENCNQSRLLAGG